MSVSTSFSYEPLQPSFQPEAYKNPFCFSEATRGIKQRIEAENAARVFRSFLSEADPERSPCLTGGSTDFVEGFKRAASKAGEALSDAMEEHVTVPSAEGNSLDKTCSRFTRTNTALSAIDITTTTADKVAEVAKLAGIASVVSDVANPISLVSSGVGIFASCSKMELLERSLQVFSQTPTSRAVLLQLLVLNPKDESSLYDIENFSKDKLTVLKKLVGKDLVKLILSTNFADHEQERAIAEKIEERLEINLRIEKLKVLRNSISGGAAVLAPFTHGATIPITFGCAAWSVADHIPGLEPSERLARSMLESDIRTSKRDALIAEARGGECRGVTLLKSCTDYLQDEPPMSKFRRVKKPHKSSCDLDDGVEMSSIY